MEGLNLSLGLFCDVANFGLTYQCAATTLRNAVPCNVFVINPYANNCHLRNQCGVLKYMLVGVVVLWTECQRKLHKPHITFIDFFVGCPKILGNYYHS